VFNAGDASKGVPTGTRNAYRFMNGSSLRYYVPGGPAWDTGTGNCYTLGTADSWGSCTAHPGGKTGITTLQRPLSY
jgi:hypothetical protein